MKSCQIRHSESHGHVDVVYSAALRQVHDPHWAQEVTQRVFILLAQKARWMGKNTILTGWLYRSTRYVASEVMRSENRRRIREQEAMQTRDEPADNSPWTEIAPLLDEAMARLNGPDFHLNPRSLGIYDDS